MKRSATISDDGRYRYRLDREWDAAGATATWVMLNPSTADAARDDATVRRVVAFTRRHGRLGRAVIVNLFAYRATDPAALLDVDDPVGPSNNGYITDAVREAARSAGIIVAAWGARAARWPDRVERVDRVLPLATVCLGRTKGGHPRHPLYVPDVTPFAYYRLTSENALSAAVTDEHGAGHGVVYDGDGT